MCAVAHGTHKSHNRLWALAIWENMILCEQNYCCGRFLGSGKTCHLTLRNRSHFTTMENKFGQKKICVSASDIAVLYFLLQT